MLGILASLILLLFLFVIVLLNVPQVQNLAKDVGVNYLNKKLGTTVRLNHLRINFPNSVTLDSLYVEDPAKDTLTSLGHLFVSLDMWGLLSGEVHVDSISINNFYANVYRKLPDTTFNFNYIMEAFGSDDTNEEQTDTSSSSMDLSIGSINLSNIRLKYDDTLSGYNGNVSLGSFRTHFDSLDLNQMSFVLDSVMLDHLKVNLVKNEPLKAASIASNEKVHSETETETSMPYLKLTGLFLNDIQLYYLDKTTNMQGTVFLDKFLVIPRKMDLNNNDIHLRKIGMDSSLLAFSMKSNTQSNTSDTASNSTEKDSLSMPWNISLDTLQLVQNHFKFDDNSYPKQKEGMDFNHLDISDFVLLASDLSYTEDSSAVMLKKLSFKEQSGFYLKKLTTQATYSNQGADLNDLLLLTNNSRISRKINISYPSLETLSDSLGKMGMDISIDSARIGLKDLYYFQPELAQNEYLSGLSNQPILLDGKIEGKLDNVTLEKLSVQLAQQTSLSLQGHLKDILDPNKSYLNINLDHFKTGRKDIKTLVPQDVLPSSIEIPKRIALDGVYNGSLNTFKTNLHLKSSDGTMAIKAAVNNLDDSVHANYRSTLSAHQIRLDRILKNDSLYGPVSLNMHLQGKGLDLKTMQAKIKGEITQARYLGYTYKDLNLKGQINHEVGQLSAEMDDPNIQFSLVSSADFKDTIPSASLDFNLKNMALHHLHLSPEKLKLKGQIKGNFDALDLDKLDGKLAFRNWNIQRKEGDIQIDSVTLKATHKNGQNELKLKSSLAKADINGNYKLSEVGPLFDRLQEKYFETDTSKINKDTLSPWKMKVNIALLSSPLWKDILPDLTQFKGGNIAGKLSSKPDSVALHTFIHPFIYNGITVDSVRLNLLPYKNRLKYGLAVHDISDSNMIDIPHLFLNGGIGTKYISVNLNTKDKDKKNRFRISGNLKMEDSSYLFSLVKDSLLLNYDSWTVPADNKIVFGPEGLDIHHLKLQKGNQYLLANNDSTLKGNPLNIAFKHFDITTLTPLFLSDSIEIGGEINGNAKVSNLATYPLFNADIHLDSLSFDSSDIGSLAVKANNKKEDTYQLNVQLEGNENDLKIAGEYDTKDSGSFDFDVNINGLSMATVQAFSFGQIKNSSGKITGNLKLKGTTVAPQIDGNVYFKNGNFKVTALGENLKLKNEGILFNSSGIHFNDFTLLNGHDDKAIIDGDILTKRYEHFQFDLDLQADEFQVLNIPKAKNIPFYGNVILSTKAHITGDENLPKVNMSVQLDNGTDFTYVMLDENPQAVSSEGIVKFINPKKLKDSTRLVFADTSRYTQKLQGIDLSANIVIDTNALFNIVVDPMSGDNLFVRGKANLNFTMDPGGKMSLTGRYNLIKGVYNLSFEGLVKKKFTLLRGSYINWKGDPMKADMNITAEYDVKTSPLELIEDQLSNDNESAHEAYKQKLPFQVFLHVKGKLMQPDISFGLGMPEDARQALDGAVYTRINQINTEPSEVNKQTLGLLVFGHFIADNPLKTSAGGGAGEMVRESANKILSQQLNKLAGNLVNGVDVNLALESSKDYSSGEAENKTNLNVGLSKSLFNDRTTVYVGGDIPLEGNNEKKSTQIVGDVAVEYKLSKDGRYRVRAYRKNKYQGVIEGEFVETGLSFIIVMNYNKFKELFKSTSALEKEQ